MKVSEVEVQQSDSRLQLPVQLVAWQTVHMCIQRVPVSSDF